MWKCRKCDGSSIILATYDQIAVGIKKITVIKNLSTKYRCLCCNNTANTLRELADWRSNDEKE